MELNWNRAGVSSHCRGTLGGNHDLCLSVHLSAGGPEIGLFCSHVLTPPHTCTIMILTYAVTQSHDIGWPRGCQASQSRASCFLDPFFFQQFEPDDLLYSTIVIVSPRNPRSLRILESPGIPGSSRIPSSLHCFKA